MGLKELRPSKSSPQPKLHGIYTINGSFEINKVTHTCYINLFRYVEMINIHFQYLTLQLKSLTANHVHYGTVSVFRCPIQLVLQWQVIR